MKHKKIALWCNLVFLILILVSDCLFISGLFNPYFIKTTASALFVLAAGFNLTLSLIDYKGKQSLKTIIIFVGIVFAFVGDVLLIDHFVLGAVFFAIGHIFFLSFFISYQKLSLADFLCLAALLIFAFLLIFLYDGFEFNGMKMVVIVYACIISIMLSKAAGNLISKHSKVNLVLFIGAFLFYFSDLMLLFNNFTSLSKIFDILCLVTYYPAEFLLGLSILLVSSEDYSLSGKLVN